MIRHYLFIRCSLFGDY